MVVEDTNSIQMKYLHPLLAFALMALIPLVGCQKDSSLSKPNATLQSSFQLELGSSTYVEEANFNLFFAQLLDDQRCPSQEECVYRGQARVKVVLQHTDGQIEEFLLIDGENEQKREVNYNGYQIKLEQVAPWPNGRSIPVEDYSITLNIHPQ